MVILVLEDEGLGCWNPMLILKDKGKILLVILESKKTTMLLVHLWCAL